MLPFGIFPGHAAPDPLMILLLALGLDALIGDAQRLFRLIPHPVVVVGRIIDRAERKLNRETRSQADRAKRGAALAVVMVLGAAAVGWVISFVGGVLPHAWVFEVFIAASLIAQRGLFDHVHRVQTALQTGGLGAGREAVSHIVGRDPASLDAHGVARAAIESCAENFADAVVAPTFWFVLFGLPGLLVYKTVNTLDSMIGHRSDRFRAFGMVSARLDDAMNLIPARLSGLILTAAAAFAPNATPWGAARVMLKDARNHRSPNSGWPEAAMAGALGLSLAGPRRYPGLVVEDKWIGAGRTTATPADIQSALRVFAIGCLINFGLVTGVWVLKLKF